MYGQAPFTVKWLRNDGHVMLLPACIISVEPHEVPMPPAGAPIHRDIQRPPKKMEFDSGDGSGVRSAIDSGVVYVMNQNGKTVETLYFPDTAAASEAA